MATFRIHKTNDFTIMSNTHLRDKNLSLKSKGLISVMLSLPDEWNYSIVGLTSLSKDGKDSVIASLNELCKFGYVKMTNQRNHKGQYETIYDIYENPNREIQCGKSESGNPSLLNTNNNNTKKINTNNNNNITPYIPQGGLESELTRSELIFEEFRKFYKGTKRGLKTEFENFKKKHKDWKEVLPTLLEKYKAQKEAKEKIRLNGGFVPQEKNLQTYLNQRCWEEEINTTNELAKYGTISTQQTGTSEKPHERVLREMLEFTRNNVPELC